LFELFAFDPPKTLAPASALVPSPTPAVQAGAQVTPAMPSATLGSPPTQTPMISSAAKVEPTSIPADSTRAADPTKAADPTRAADPATSAHPKDNTNNGVPTSDIPQVSSPNPGAPQGDSPNPGPSNGLRNPSAKLSTGDPSGGNPQPDPNGIAQPKANAPPKSDPPVVAIGSQTFTALPSGGFAIADSTVHANDPAITIQGVPVSLGHSALVAGSSTVLLPTGSSNGVFTAAGHTFTPQAESGIIVAGNTLSINGPAATVSGIAVSLASSGLVIGSQTFAVPTAMTNPEPSANSVFTAAGHAFTPQPGPAVIVAGNALSINGPAATVSGTAVSLASSGLVIGSQTFAIPTAVQSPEPSANSVFTVAGQVITPHGADAAIIAGTTLSMSGPAATISNTVISLPSSGIIIGGQTFALPTSALGKMVDTVVIEGTTLTAGGPAATVAGTPVSLALGSTGGLYVAGLGSGSAAFSAPVVAGESISMNTAGQVVVDGNTVSGSVAGTLGLGSAIMLGFGPASATSGATATDSGSGMTPSNPSNATGVLGFTGEGRKTFELRLMEVLLPVSVFMGWELWIYMAKRS